MKSTAFAFLALLAATPLFAGDVDMRLTTADGTTKMTVQDSGSVEVSSISSDGDAYFASVNTPVAVLSSATVMGQLMVGNTKVQGSNGSNTDNYFAVPMNSAAALAAKSSVILTPSGVNTTTTASSNTVIGITVSATSGANQLVWVAVAGIVTSVTCNNGMQINTRVCTSASAGRVQYCTSLTNASIAIGRMITTCTAGGTGTVLLRLD